MTITEVAELGTVCAVFAHPDDEAYLCGGLMALAVAGGARVICVTATRGELGVTDPARWPPESLAQIRTQELAACLAIFGVTEHRWLDYPDGGCDAIPLEEGAGRIAAILQEVRPDTVLSFAPDGQTGHPDHIAVHHWTAEAVRRTGIGAFHVVANTADWTDEFLGLMAELGILMGDPPVTWTGPLSIELALSPDLIALKNRALAAQASQTEGLRAQIGQERYERVWKTERFRLFP